MTTGVGVAPRSPTMRYHVSRPFHDMRPSDISCSFREQRMVARGVAPVAVVGEQRTLDLADLGRISAARVEATAGRRIDWTRYLPLQHDSLTPCRAFHDVVFDRGNRREQRLCVRVDRLQE